MASVFKNYPTSASQTLTSNNQVVYGPVPGATTAVVFDGTIANTDTSGLADQTVTVSIQRTGGGAYDVVLQSITIPFGSSFQLPKMVLMSGENLCMSHTNGKLAAKVHLVELS